MPELPEVQTITTDLDRELRGGQILEVIISQPRLAVPNPDVLRQACLSSTIKRVRRVAKSIVFELGSVINPEPVYLVFYLRMTGRLLLRPEGFRPDDWVRITFKVKRPDGSGQVQILELRFAETRMFGFVEVLDGQRLTEHQAKYGPDALDPSLTAQVFWQRLRLKKTNLKQALLEQSLIAGAGNIYANDSLWQARLHPQTSTQDLSLPQAQLLLESLQELLEESIEHRGSTLNDKMYVDIFGREGSHQNYFRVFGKTGQPCPRCATRIEFLELGGRGTFFCPSCQPRPGRSKVTSIPRNQLDFKI